ncbi:MAG: alpha/beta hydrolase, partial [Ignavibacteria bacterium]
KELIKATVNGFFENVSFPKVSVLGHSRGGADSILASWKNENVEKLVTWASIAKLDRYSDRQKEEWKEKGFWEVLNTRTNQLMRLNYSLLEDILKNKDTSLNLERAVSELEIPYLILHGDQDLAVPVDEAKQLYEWSDKENTQIHIIEKTGHTFDIKHPFEETNSKFEQLISLTLNFLKN